MRSRLTFLLVICGLAAVFVAGSFFSEHNSLNKKLDDPNRYRGISYKLEDAPKVQSNNKNTKTPLFNSVNTPPPTDTVPGLSTFNDYSTNGNSLSQLLVSGDTIICSNTYLDSNDVSNVNGTNSLRIRYNYSVDGGVTWNPTGIDLSNGGKSRYGDLSLMTIAGSRTVATTGRYWDDGTSTNRHPGGSYDALLGLGSPTVTFMPAGYSGGSDLFSYLRNDNKKACMLQTLGVTGDTLLYSTWDPGAATYSAKKVIDTRVLSNTVCAYNIGCSDNASHMTAAWCYVNEPTSGGDPLPSVRYSSSTDGGNTWSASAKLLGNAFIAGDSAAAYWHTEVAYKPNTSTPYVAFCTRDITVTYTMLADQRRAWKIVGWSPAVNSGNPFVIADWHNIPFMADTVQFGRSLTKQAINDAVFGHPSLGFSTDGSVLYCTFSVTQPDTASDGFNYHDTYLTWSLDNGATWVASPVNVSNTPTWDEVYPVIAPKGNTNNTAYICYLSTSNPGCQVFTDLNAISKVYEVFKKVQTPIGIINISSEVPGKFTLMQNYPNPFNPTTRIRFALPKSANVTINIYNAIGQLVTTLANNEFEAAGTKEVTFDASNFASGIYFYSVKAGDFQDTKKMILIK